MKLLVIGCGQGGGRVADEFARQNMLAHTKRGINILTGVLAVNTDTADLSGLSYIKADYRHRILIGGQRTRGHGVGKVNEVGAEVAKEDGDKLLEGIRAVERFAETDAFLLIAAAAGGTGSGSVSVLTRQIKERYPEKPIYAIIVLPFRYEEITEERTIYNVGTCLKSVYLVADTVFLIDNQRYVREKNSIRSNFANINYRIVTPFYNLLCPGEETNRKYIGGRVLDAGDILETLAGWAIIGYGTANIPRIKMFDGKFDFRNKANATLRGVQAMNQAISTLSLDCKPADAKRALYLLTAPPGEMTIDMINQISSYLKRVAPEAIIRSGDYPRGKGSIDVTVVLSELTNSRKVMDYFNKALRYTHLTNKRRGGAEYEYRGMEGDLSDIPSLL
ncbi:tubulin/FtsZ family protein [Chloroflexota bacterium]